MPFQYPFMQLPKHARQTRWRERTETDYPQKLGVSMSPTMRQSGPRRRHGIWPPPRSGAVIFCLRLCSIRSSNSNA